MVQTEAVNRHDMEQQSAATPGENAQPCVSYQHVGTENQFSANREFLCTASGSWSMPELSQQQMHFMSEEPTLLRMDWIEWYVGLSHEDPSIEMEVRRT
eukprot:756145-Hanusia_phi.AAC.1